MQRFKGRRGIARAGGHRDLVAQPEELLLQERHSFPVPLQHGQALNLESFLRRSLSELLRFSLQPFPLCSSALLFSSVTTPAQFPALEAFQAVGCTSFQVLLIP